MPQSQNIPNNQGGQYDVSQQISLLSTDIRGLAEKIDSIKEATDDLKERVVKIETQMDTVGKFTEEITKINENVIAHKISIFGHNGNSGLHERLNILSKDVDNTKKSLNKISGVAMAASFLLPILISMVMKYIELN